MHIAIKPINYIQSRVLLLGMNSLIVMTGCDQSPSDIKCTPEQTQALDASGNPYCIEYSKKEITPAVPIPQSLVCALGFNDKECVKTLNTYGYDKAYGGRSLDGKSLTQQSKLDVDIPNGWHNGSTSIEFSDSNLTPENILIGISIFGVTGNYNPGTNTLPACQLGGPRNNCIASTGQYLFSKAYNGRSMNCSTESSSLQTNCWVSASATSAVYVRDSSPQITPDCNSHGKQSAECNTTSGYVYKDNSGGRDNNCLD